MRRAEFSPEEIIAAGEALQAAARDVTGFALRQKVGGGNANRLKQIWDEHLAAKNTAKAGSVTELPTEVAEELAAVSKSLTERLAALVGELNDKAVQAAEGRVAEVLHTAGEQQEKAQRELVDAAQTIDDLEARLDEAQLESKSLSKRLEESQLQAQAQAVELAQLRERLAAMEQSARSATDSHTRELDQAKAETEAVRTDLDSARHDSEKKIEALRGELAQVREKLAASEQAGKVAADNHARELGQSRAEAKAARADLESSVAKVETLRGELAEQKARVAADTRTHAEYRSRAEQEADQLSALLGEAKKAQEVARREAGEAREVVARISGQLEAVQAQNTALLAAVHQQSGMGK